MKPQIFVSVDIEADGPIPGYNSMLSFGAAAFDEDGKLISTFTRNLYPIEGGVQNVDTMEWWSKQPKAWAECRTDLQDPLIAMDLFNRWIRTLPGSPVFIGYPTGFDFTFMYWYMIRFTKYSPFSFSAIDIKTYACAMLKTPFRETAKRSFPKRWFSNRPHTHKALDDAIEQGEMFMAMYKEHMSK